MSRVSIDDIVAAFGRQSAFCRDRKAPLTASLIDGAAADISHGGPLLSFVQNFGEDPGKGALALRIAGALHYLVIKNRADDLAGIYKAPKELDLDAARGHIAALVETEPAVFRKFIANPPQTNEINRAAALLPGLSLIAEKTGLPLDLYELGASGGLLLAIDRCAIDYGAFTWGKGAVPLRAEWRGRPSNFPALNIEKRLGCDRKPIDFSDPEQLDIAHSYIWPEHAERRRLFDIAIKEAARSDAKVERAEAVQWTAGLALPRPGAASVIYSSVFQVYLNDAEREELRSIIENFGAHATGEAPVAWLRFEPEEEGNAVAFFVDLTIWPGGETRRIAKAQPHAEWVEPLN